MASKPLASSDEALAALAAVWTALVVAIGCPEAWSLATLCFHYCLNSGMQVECVSEWCEVSNTCQGLHHDAVPVFHSGFSVPQAKENVSEVNLLGIFSSLMHDVCEGEGLVNLEAGSSSLV